MTHAVSRRGSGQTSAECCFHVFVGALRPLMSTAIMEYASEDRLVSLSGADLRHARAAQRSNEGRLDLHASQCENVLST